MSKKIVFINQATGYLTIDIINEFAKVIEEVALITGSIRVQDTMLDHKVKVISILKYNRGNNFKKALFWFLGTLQIFFLLKFKFRDFEKIFFTVPPTAYLMALNFKSVFSIVVFDLYPEALKSNAISEKKVLYKWWSNKNRQVFQKAHKVYTLSENMKAQVLNYSTDIDVRVISNWSAFSDLTPIKKNMNGFIINEGLQGKFIIQYSGNIGVTHNVETLVEVADMLRMNDEIVFLIIGRGKRTGIIRELISKKGLKNCILLPFRKDEELYESLCSADLAIITLDERRVDISVPSKIYNIMSAGVPVMAIAPTHSGVSEIVLRHQIGKVFEKSNLSGMCDFVLDLVQNPTYRENLSLNSLQASKFYTKSNASKYIEYYYE
jgi:glycosyltransferase involved in cell wall biosynthesis